MKIISVPSPKVTIIYALCERDLTPRYVGKTTQSLRKRYQGHMGDVGRGSRLPVHRWMAKRALENAAIVIRPIEYIPPGEDWASRERHWISEYRAQDCNLLNLTDGGEGLVGHTFTRAHRDKIAAANRTGATLSCEICGSHFWRKKNQIKKGESRFCSRSCYGKSQIGVSKPMTAECIKLGISAAALARKARTECKRGHPLSGGNLYLDNCGRRHCMSCRKIHKEKYMRKVNG